MNLGSRDLNLLVALQALLEEGNVTRAGDRLGIGQSGMSAALARLRQHYGDELLIRVGRDFELTPVARLLLVEVRATMPLLEQALGIEDAFDPALTSRRFTVAASDFAWLEIMDRLEQVGASAPRVAIDLLPLPVGPGVANADLLRYDFIAGPPETSADGASEVLIRDTYVCVVDRDNPAVRSGGLSIEDFFALPYAMAGFGPYLRTPVDRRLRELGLVREPAATTHGYLPLGAVIEGTALVAAVPGRVADRLTALNRISVVAAPFGPVESVEALWWHPSRAGDEGHRWLRDRMLGLGGTAGSPR